MLFKFKLVESIQDSALIEDNRPYKLYTDGKKTIRVCDGEEVPPGFVRGQHHHHQAWNKGLKASETPSIQKSLDAARQALVGKDPWNKGLTKDDDPRIVGLSGSRNPMFGKHPEAWNKGLTKDTDDRMKKASDNHKGCVAWNKGIPTGFHWTAELFQKRYETQMRNGTLGKNVDTKAEREFYDYLLTIYDKSDIIHPYMDKQRYPFRCDFYIIPEDKFIEIHGNWTHGGRPYDPNDEECQKQLAIWEEKAKTSDYYKNAIYTWTDLDVRKVETARKNNLNFEVIYYKY